MHIKIENSTILVTGGAGFIGSHVVEKLLPYNPAKIVIVDNMLRGVAANMESFIRNPAVEFVRDDICNRPVMESLISRSDFIFHLAAHRITRCADNPSEAFEVMARATFDIIDLARRYTVKKIVYSSSASIYGLAKTFPTSEDTPPYDNKTLYGAAKLFGEQLLRSYYEMHGLNYIALRYFNVYGPRMDREGKYTEVMIKWLDCFGTGIEPKIHGNGAATMDFIYVEDIAEANVKALLADATNEVINIGFGRETSLKELLEILLSINNCRLCPVFVEERKVNAVTRRLADITKAKKLLDFEPKVPLEEGLKKLSAWYYHEHP